MHSIVDEDSPLSPLTVPVLGEGTTPFTTAPSSGHHTPFLRSYSPTPSDSGAQFSAHSNASIRRAMTSFENLVALANSQERLKYVLANRTQTWKEARKMVWRDRGEPVAELADLEECLRWAAKGGLRAATLAFNVRACFNIVLALIRIRSVPKKHRVLLIQRAIFGLDTWRFAAMLGSFVSIYKFFLNALPLLAPSTRSHKVDHSSPFFDEDDDEAADTLPTTSFDVPVPPTPHPNTAKKIHLRDRQRMERLSLSTQAQRILVRKKTKRWHAALAGAIAGGLAVLWEKRGRRVTIAQQMFVRGLQGSYNSYTTKRNIHVPHGDVLVFSLVCGQILYAWLLRPDTLPRSYSAWVSNAAKVPHPGVRMNHDMFRKHAFDVKDLDSIVSRSDITPSNRSYLLTLKELSLSLPNMSPESVPYFPHYGPCAAIHPAQTSCLSVPLTRFVEVFRWMLPIYGALHFVPAVLFKRNAFIKNPLQVLRKAAIGTGRSSAFLGLFVIIYQSTNCFNHQLHEYLCTLSPSSPLFPLVQKIPKFIIDMLVSKFAFWFPGFMSGLALLVEEKRRRPELTMYVLPKGLESLWVVTTGKVGLKRWRGGEGLLTALGMAMVMSTYQNDPQHLSGLVRRILYQFIGPN